VADVIEAHYVDPHTRHGRVFAGIHQEALFPDTPILGAYVEGWRRLRAVFTDYLRPLVDARPELGDLDQLARAVQSAVVGINLQSHLDHDMDRRAAYTALEKVFESVTS
jgi:hypothetical protein